MCASRRGAGAWGGVGPRGGICGQEGRVGKQLLPLALPTGGIVAVVVLVVVKAVVFTRGLHIG